MHRFIFLLVAALVFSACTKASSVTTPVVVGPSTLDSVVSDEALQAAAPLSALSAIVPQNVDAIAAIDFSRLGGHAAAAIGGNEALAALETDLKAIFGRLLGPDLTAAGYAIAWLAHEEDALGLVLRGDFGKERLKGKALKKVAGVKAFPIEELFLAKIGPHVVVGNEAALKAMVAVRKGKRRSLLKSSAFATIDKGLSLVKGPKPVALVSAGPALLKQALGGGPLGQVEIEQLSIGLGEDLSLRAAVQADQGIRTLITGMVEDGRKAAAQEAEKTRLRALEDDDLLGAVGGAVMAHSMLSAVKMLKLETRDEALIASFEAASDAGTYLAVTSVVAAIAIPSFVKYQRRAKTTEAIDQLDRIYKGAAIYYTTHTTTLPESDCPVSFQPLRGSRRSRDLLLKWGPWGTR